MLSCREVVSSADALVDEELSWRQRLPLRLHLLLCRHCRRYVRNFRRLLRAVPFMHRPASDEEVEQVMERVRDADRPPAD